MILGIDIETYSSVDLKSHGVYKYSESPDFEILLFAYAIDDEPVQVVDLALGESIPQDIISMLTDPDVQKAAYNASFERVCLSRYLGLPQGEYLSPDQWKCTQVQALTLGLPRSLADAGRALGLPEEKAKMKEGAALIRYFCVPCRPTSSNGGRTRNYPKHDPEKWRVFKAYNLRDVETERTIRHICETRPSPDIEWQAYWLDQRINDRGVLVDAELAEAAVAINQQHGQELTDEAKSITGLENTNSVAQLKQWLGHEGSLDKKAIIAMRDSGDLDDDADRVLAIRQELGKSSVTKYNAMLKSRCNDGRVRGLFQFYGANRTGRWAGRLVQVQNLPQNHLPDLDVAREIVKDHDRDGLQCLFGNVPSTLSELIRTAFVAQPGYTFAVADFSAIEARVTAWYANEKWRQNVFEQGKDIYCASASQMFKVPVEKHGINGHLRQKGKIAELALGYGGSVGAMKTMGAIEMGLTEDELKPIVNAWRASNPHIVNLWWKVDDLVRFALQAPGSIQTITVAFGQKIVAKVSKHLLSIQLPSGRCLHYWDPAIVFDPETGRDNITYESTEDGKWVRTETYGPKLVENIVQATARDCLRDAMLRVAKKWPRIVMHVHDEMIVEVPKADADRALSEMEACMAEPIAWAPGLLLRGDGYTTDYYRKD